MGFETYLRFLFALLLVLGLIAILAWLLRRFGMGSALRGNARRLQVLETSALGPRHRLVLIRRDSVEHLLLLGPQGDLVVERGIAHASFAKELEKPEKDGTESTRPLQRHEPPSLFPRTGGGTTNNGDPTT